MSLYVVSTAFIPAKGSAQALSLSRETVATAVYINTGSKHKTNQMISIIAQQIINCFAPTANVSTVIMAYTQP